MAWHGMAGSLAGWLVFGEACMPCAYDTYIFQSLPKSPVGSTEAQGTTPARRAARRQQTGTHTRSHQKSKSKNVLDSAREARISRHAPVRQLARSSPFPSGASPQIGRQAASPSGATDCDVRAELQTLRREARSKIPSVASAPCRCFPSHALLPLPRRASAFSGTWACKLQGFIVGFGSGASCIGQAVRMVALCAPLRRPRRSQPSFPTQSEPSSVQPAS
ncbi:uncharacterized protein PSANT_02732 [Moesziomyces antarcticus]|uniref:Uncharacterized protein n=1 Tax=Pseudozyma antarctica TaxID=84753 RepID=A0A5C3FLG4_PSEA2|nr:uncharacterized protein PSANT_02732 [Moesziomyces antarcticus]